MDKQFVYDVNNNLIGTILNGTPQHWTVWDGKNPYIELDGTGNVTERILADPQTLNALFGQVSASGQAEFYLTDPQHSVRMIVDTTGNVLDQITYDAYGNILTQTNAANASLYLFQGGYLDSDLGLYRFGARWYDPNGGRWISQDPMSFAAGDSNLYRYVTNGPTNATDPTGLWSWRSFGIGVAYAAMTVAVVLVIAGTGGIGTPFIVGAIALSGVAATGYVAGSSAQNESSANDAQAAGIGITGGLITGAATVVAAALIPACATATVNADRIAPSIANGPPVPPGWGIDWSWGPPSGEADGAWRWWDSDGGEWRWHAPDQWHTTGHWDYNPWTAWNSAWQNVPATPPPPANP